MTLDNTTARKFQKLEPHVNGFSMSKPLEVSSNVWLPKPLVENISAWLRDDSHNTPDPVRLAKMEALLK